MAISNDRKKSLAGVLDKINKKFGAGAVSFVKDVEDKLRVEFYKTPSHEYNIMLNGGFGRGRIVELFGENSSGKTTLAIETIAKNQKENPDFVAGWFETEGSVDPEQLRTFGVDMDRLVYWDQTDTGAEQGFDILRGLVASGEFNMIVVNSVAGLAPKIEIEGDMEKANVAVTARLLSKLFRVITGSAYKNKTTLLFINQTRTNVGVMFGDPTTTSGGKALAFYASQRINMRKVKLQAADPISEDQGLKITSKVVKNRLANRNPYTKCDYYAIYGEGIDAVSEMPDILEREGLLRKSGAWYYWEDVNGKVINLDGLECKFRSRTALVEALKGNAKLKEEFEKMLDQALFSGKAKATSMTAEEVSAAEEQNKKVEQALAEDGALPDEGDLPEGENIDLIP
jgi:recombination protein RecA